MRLCQYGITFSLILISLFTSFGQSRWKVEKSTVLFSIKNAGITVNGSFGPIQAEINFYPEHLAASSIVASLDVNSINTGIALRDKHLKKEEYFDVEHYPSITIKSLSFAKGKEGAVIGTFLLTIKNTTKQISIPFSYTETGLITKFTSQFRLNRCDFGVGASSWTMADNVDISVQIEARK